jgi:hypothetical protein
MIATTGTDASLGQPIEKHKKKGCASLLLVQTNPSTIYHLIRKAHKRRDKNEKLSAVLSTL